MYVQRSTEHTAVYHLRTYACIIFMALRSYGNLCHNSDGATSTIDAVSIHECSIYVLYAYKIITKTIQLIFLAIKAVKFV